MLCFDMLLRVSIAPILLLLHLSPTYWWQNGLYYDVKLSLICANTLMTIYYIIMWNSVQYIIKKLIITRKFMYTVAHELVKNMNTHPCSTHVYHTYFAHNKLCQIFQYTMHRMLFASCHSSFYIAFSEYLSIH